MATESKAILHTIEDLETEQVNPLIRRRLISGEKVMFAHLQLKKGCVVPFHHHHNEQLSYIVQGALRFWLGEEREEVVVRAGQVLQIPSNLPHKAEALEDTLNIDLFSPPREDWLQGTDDYLRRT